MGPYPLERLSRVKFLGDTGSIPAFKQLKFAKKDQPENIINAMSDAQAMLDAVCDGLINNVRGEVPEDLTERQNHLKAFGYYTDVAMAATCGLEKSMILNQPVRNRDIDWLAEKLKTAQTKTIASGIDVIMADLRDAMNAPPKDISSHKHALVFLMEQPREVRSDEPGAQWLAGAGHHRSALRAMEAAVVLAQYIRLLGYEARAHSHSTSDVNLNHLAVAAGIGDCGRRCIGEPVSG